MVLPQRDTQDQDLCHWTDPSDPSTFLQSPEEVERAIFLALWLASGSSQWGAEKSIRKEESKANDIRSLGPSLQTCRQRSHFPEDVRLPPALSIPIASNWSSRPLLAHSGPVSWSPEVPDLESRGNPAVSPVPDHTPANPPHIMLIWAGHLFPAGPLPDARPPPCTSISGLHCPPMEQDQQTMPS